MTTKQVQQALGDTYQYTTQMEKRVLNISFLTAWGADSAYAVTFWAGKAAAFEYAREYAPGARPLEINMINGVTAKTWQAIDVRPGYRAIWITNSSGQPQLRPTMDNTVHPRAHVATISNGPVPPGLQRNGASYPVPDLVAPSNYKSECGVTIEMRLNRPSPNNGEDESFKMAVADTALLRQAMQTVNTITQQQSKAAHDKLNSVPTPF